jgi:hypothetical protein
MSVMTEIFFPPSLDWFKRTAKKLRKHVGRDVLKLSNAYDLLARIYGYAHFAELSHFRRTGDVFPTVWDNELDERTMAERVYLQVSVLTSYLEITDDEAAQMLEVLHLSGYRTPAEAASRDDVEDFSQRLDAMLQMHRTAASGSLSETKRRQRQSSLTRRDVWYPLTALRGQRRNATRSVELAVAWRQLFTETASHPRKSIYSKFMLIDIHYAVAKTRLGPCPASTLPSR